MLLHSVYGVREADHLRQLFKWHQYSYDIKSLTEDRKTPSICLAPAPCTVKMRKNGCISQEQLCAVLTRGLWRPLDESYDVQRVHEQPRLLPAQKQGTSRAPGQG